MGEDDLLPCPFCGCNQAMHCTTEDAVVCGNCGTIGPFASAGKIEAVKRWNIRADIPPTREMIEAMVPELPWECFDAWTWWAKTSIGNYRVNERQGRWSASIGFGTSSIHKELEAQDNTEASAKAACQAEFVRIATAALLPQGGE